MPNLDIRTLALILGVASVLQALVFALYYAVGARYPGMRLWTFSSVANAIGFVLILLRGAIPDTLSILVGNWFLLLGQVLLFRGVGLFIDQRNRTQDRIVVALVGAVAVAWVPLTFVFPSVSARTVLISLCAALVYVLAGWKLARGAPHELVASYRFTATVFVLYSAFSIFRALVIIFNTQLQTIFDQTGQNLLAYLVLLVTIVLWAAGVVAMGTQRLLRDLRMAQMSEAVLLQQAAREASEREQLFRVTFDQSPIGAALTDFECRFVRVNPVLCEITGYREDELLTLDVGTITHPDDLSNDMAQAAALVAGEIESYSQEKRYIRKEGTVVWVQLTGRLLRNAQGAPLHFLGLIEDISARKRAEHALRHRIDELLALNQIAQALATWTNLTAGLNSVAPVLCTVFQADAISVWSHEPSDGVLVRLIALDVETTISDKQKVRLNALASEATLLSLVSATVFHLPPTDHVLVHKTDKIEEQSEHVLLVPLRARNELVGIVAICPRKPHHLYSPSDIALAQTIGGVLGSAIENARLFELAQSQAAERERRRLANELHDSVSQSLFAAKRTADVLPQLWELDPDEGRQALADISRFTGGALAEMRALLIELRPHVLAEVPLHQSLGYLTPILANKGAASVQAELEPVPILPTDVQLALYRIAQEALNNVSKHAGASHVGLRLQTSPPYHAHEDWCGTVTLVVQDDGRGYQNGCIPVGRLGLLSMRERASDIGATLNMESSPAQGTQVIVQWQGAAAAQGEA